MLDYARSDAPQVRAVVAVIGQPNCVLIDGLSRNQIAALQHHGALHLATPLKASASCPWLLTGTSAAAAQHLAPQRWSLATQIARPTDKADFIRIYRRRVN